MVKYSDYTILWKIKINILILINIFLNVLKHICFKNLDVELISKPTSLVTIIKIFRSASTFRISQLIDLVGTQIVGKVTKYNVIYLILSTIYQIRINIYMQILNINAVQSIVKVFVNSGWLEREIWDMFGIFFENNINLQRILTDYGFAGHPLKKSFSLPGYYELNYSFIKKFIEPKLPTVEQGFRDLLSENLFQFSYWTVENQELDLQSFSSSDLINYYNDIILIVEKWDLFYINEIPFWKIMIGTYYYLLTMSTQFIFISKNIYKRINIVEPITVC